MACRKNQVTFNTNISQFNSYMLYVSSYISNGEKKKKKKKKKKKTR